MDAFDSDVLIYAAAAGNALGRGVAELLTRPAGDDRKLGLGSVLLLPEVLTKPRRDGASESEAELRRLLARLDLRDVDRTIAERAVAVGVSYRLKAADAIHLATAVHAGADRFITNNRGDFPKSIAEVEVTYPDEL